MHKITQPKLFSRGSKLWIRFSFNNQNIRKALNLEDTKENRKLANLQIIPQILLKVYEGTFFDNTNNVPTVDEYMMRSFKLHRGNRSDSTNLMYVRNYNKHIKNVFGNIQLDKITGEDITHWQNNLRENEHLAKGSILRIRSCLNVMFEDAIENNLIQKNPVSKAKKLRETDNPKIKRVKLKPFNLIEIKSILDVLNDSDKNLIATLFYTGARISEILGLMWKYVDFNRKTISIREQMVNGEQKQILKTTKSQRIIPIIDVLMPYLQDQYKLTGKQDSYVFLTARTNKHYHSAGKIREQIWVKALKKANVEYRNLHQTRGTFISTLISNGEDINYVSKIAGHENVKVTLEKYSEYIPSKNLNFGNCFR
ncbi:site-specific integrase [Aliarcobacter cryaerophilus]|uniref:site-specific integrase n=1 Tax=Aliarcobacter cryaerophilus TaxID=28198 RepID=UPI0021B57707|nr:site-specific integrase [Aliarcobacter cryaerophilus]MCT7462209.1 site-specific integrase [Aliarcobacter cryaerophilus]MCT7529813.1 site-specific integrase [Aliarcobacter cryaerophilus]